MRLNLGWFIGGGSSTRELKSYCRINRSGSTAPIVTISSQAAVLVAGAAAGDGVVVEAGGEVIMVGEMGRRSCCWRDRGRNRRSSLRR